MRGIGHMESTFSHDATSIPWDLRRCDIAGPLAQTPTQAAYKKTFPDEVQAIQLAIDPTIVAVKIPID